jgi:spore germination protein YaaH
MKRTYTPVNFTPLKIPVPKKRNFLQVLVELDLFTHFLVVTFIITLVLAYFLNERTKEKNKIMSQNAVTQNSAQAIVASPGQYTNSIYISQQVVYIDKKYFNLPENFHLTMNGPMKKDVFGYLPYWMISNLKSIDTRMLTSLSYFGLEINSDGQILNSVQKDSFNPYDIWQNDINLKAFLDQAKKNKIKIFVTFKSFNNDTIEKLVSSSESSQNFLNTVLYQVNSHNLDGVNIDFEYTGIPDTKIRDKFSVLMSTLNDALKSQGSKTALNISVYATAATINQLWDIPYLSNHSDNIIVMGYDFFTPQSNSAGPIAPLSGYENSLSGMINNFLEQIPAEKIILAVPYYGYDWITENQSKNAAVKKDSEVKILSYAETADITRGKKIVWDNDSQTPWYSYIDDTGQSHVVHYENIRSLGSKYDLINKKNLSGVGIWALGLEGNDMELTQLLLDKFAH